MDAGLKEGILGGEIIEVSSGSSEKSSPRTKQMTAEQMALRAEWAKKYLDKNPTAGPWIIMAEVKKKFGTGIGYYSVRALVAKKYPRKSDSQLQSMWQSARIARTTEKSPKNPSKKVKLAVKRSVKRAFAPTAEQQLRSRLKDLTPLLEELKIEMLTAVKRDDRFGWRYQRSVVEEF